MSGYEQDRTKMIELANEDEQVTNILMEYSGCGCSSWEWSWLFDESHTNGGANNIVGNWTKHWNLRQ